MVEICPDEDQMTEGQIEKRLEPIREDIRGLRTALEAGPSIQTAPKTRGWLSRHWWQVLSIVLPTLIASGAWLQPQWSAHSANDADMNIDRRIDAKLIPQTKGVNDLAKEVGDLRVDTGKLSTKIDDFGKRLDDFVTLMKPAAREQLKVVNSLPAAQFQKDLPSIAAALDVLNRTDTQVESAITDTIRTRMQSLPVSSSGYWQAVSGLITQTHGPIRNGVTMEDALSAPTCVRSQPPKGPPDGYHETICPRGSVLDVDNMTARDSVFQDLIIRYRGRGPVVMERVTFIHCVFVIALSGPPPESGRDFVTTLLQALGSTIKV